MKEVVVYWAYSNQEALRGTEPRSVFKKHVKYLHSASLGDYAPSYIHCPAFKATLKNVYEVGSLFDFKLSVDRDDNSINCTLNNFDKNIVLRGESNTLFGVGAFLHLFTEEDGLEVTQTHAFLEDSDFVRDTITIPGTMDISKWYKPCEHSFRLRKGVDSFELGLDETAFYLDFNTDKKIKFVKYEMSERLRELSKNCANSKFEKRKILQLSYYYGLFKSNNYKEQVLKEIRKNVL